MLVSLSQNLVDAIWEDRPTRPASLVFHLDEKYSGMYSPFYSSMFCPLRSALVLISKSYQGQSHADKIIQVREELENKKAKAVVVTMLDEVAWLFNLRGSDIDFNPGESGRVPSKKGTKPFFLVFFAYTVITTEKTLLFIRQEQLNDAAREYLGDQVEIRPYDSFFDYLKGLAGTLDLGAESVRLFFSCHLYKCIN